MSKAYKIENPEGIYFLTTSVVSWVDVFTRNIYKNIVLDSLAYCQEHKGLDLYAWCLMTNHLHLVASCRQGHSLTDFTRDFKKVTSRRIIKAIENNDSESRREWMLAKFKAAGAYNSNNEKYQFWQQGNHPIELFANAVIDQKIDYLHDNPVRAGFVHYPYEWKYSSAIDFAGEKGLLALAPL